MIMVLWFDAVTLQTCIICYITKVILRARSGVLALDRSLGDSKTLCFAKT